MGRPLKFEDTMELLRDQNVSDGRMSKLFGRFGPRGYQQYSPLGYYLEENWQKKPGINADIASSSPPTDTIANRDFEVLGTNAVTADVAFRTGGGITLTTHGSASDSTIVLPHLDTAQTSWSVASWLTQKQMWYQATLAQSASVAAQTWWYGGKLTNTPVIATDDDQFMFRFDTTSTLGATKLHFITSRAGTDVDDILPVTITPSIIYTLTMELDAYMRPHVYVNGLDLTGKLSVSGRAPLVTAKNLIPYCGVLQTGASGKSLSILPGYRIGRTYA